MPTVDELRASWGVTQNSSNSGSSGGGGGSSSVDYSAFNGMSDDDAWAAFNGGSSDGGSSSQQQQEQPKQEQQPQIDNATVQGSVNQNNLMQALGYNSNGTNYWLPNQQWTNNRDLNNAAWDTYKKTGKVADIQDVWNQLVGNAANTTPTESADTGKLAPKKSDTVPYDPKLQSTKVNTSILPNEGGKSYYDPTYSIVRQKTNTGAYDSNAATTDLLKQLESGRITTGEFENLTQGLNPYDYANSIGYVLNIKNPKEVQKEGKFAKTARKENETFLNKRVDNENKEDKDWQSYLQALQDTKEQERQEKERSMLQQIAANLNSTDRADYDWQQNLNNPNVSQMRRDKDIVSSDARDKDWAAHLNDTNVNIENMARGTFETPPVPIADDNIAGLSEAYKKAQSNYVPDAQFMLENNIGNEDLERIKNYIELNDIYGRESIGSDSIIPPSATKATKKSRREVDNEKAAVEEYNRSGKAFLGEIAAKYGVSVDRMRELIRR